MPNLDVSVLCRIALEDPQPGELILDTLSRVCQDTYGAEGGAAFMAVFQAIEAQMGNGSLGPDAAVAALADGEAEPPATPRPWWHFWS
ncbi:MAG: hypothetical protein H7338_18970 [Candidatus Sericytochromatia bacterium]|nr:hypothetical protein [Candidatus Sericytochromatia bacterium]